jgi:carboxyl-terminal processing protease
MKINILKSKFILGVVTTLVFILSLSVLSNRVSAVSVDAYESLKIFTDVVNIVEESYTDDVETREIVYSAVKGLLRGLDPHSSFLTPEEYKEMQVDTKGSFGGIGIEIGLRNDVLTIISPIEDTPAFRAGLKAKDRIVKIEDKSTKDMGLMEAVKLMRGKRGTELNISVMRKGFDAPRVFTLVRAVIKIKSVKFKMLEDGYGYVRITQFQSKTGHDLEKALRELEGKDKSLKGLVLDLRNNPGGLLQQAVVVADKFLSEGMIVYTKGRAEGQDMEFSAQFNGTHPEYPIIVIVNGGSASASEIVAGALQDHKRGVILGTQTFGKGSVQTILPLSDGSAVRLTTSKYYTPSGRSIQAKGIEPDIEVGEDQFAYVKERDLEGHLKGDEEDDEKKVKKDGKKSKKKKTKKHNNLSGLEDEDEEEKEDVQLDRALEYLKSWLLYQGTKKEAS